MRYPSTTFWITKISNTNNTKRWPGCGTAWTLIHCRGECKKVQPLWKTVRQFLTKLKRLLSDDPAIALLGIYSKELTMYVCSLHKNLYMDVYSRFTEFCQNLEATKVHCSRWMDQQIMVHPDSAILISAKKNKISSHKKTWRHLKLLLLSKRNHSEKAMQTL